MKIKLNYKDAIINVPAEAVAGNIGSMTADELKVLLFICSDAGFRADTEDNRAHVIKTLDMQWAAIEEAISSLTARGFLLSDAPVQDAPAEEQTEGKTKKSKASVKADSPVYGKEETADIIGRNADLYRIINSDVPRLTGKAVNQNEATILVSLYDYLRLSAECIVKIIEFCRDKDTFSFRVVERTAYSLFDADITTPEAIDEYIERERRKNEVTQKIRDLFGIGKRALIAREKNLIKTWTETYGYGMDVITRAYEITIAAINEPKLDYAGGVMKRWYDGGLYTALQIDADIESSKTDKKKAKAAGKNNEKAKAESFDTDEFIEAAMKRSYGKK